MKDLFQSVLNMSITGSYIILAVIVLRFFLRKLPRSYSYALWAIPGLRLLIPFSMSSVFSFFNLMKPVVENQQMSHISSTVVVPAATVNGNAAVPPTVQTEPTEIILPTEPLVTEPVPQELSVDWWQVAAVLWLAVMMAILLFQLFRYLGLGRQLKYAIQTGSDCYLSDQVELPFVYGVLHPRIILPKGITKEEWPYVLAHERSHIRRRDPLIKLVAFFVLAMHWFNPLVWLGFALLCRDMEVSCDELALKRFPQDVRMDYAKALVNLSVRQNSMAFSTVLSFGKSSIKERLLVVLHSKKPTWWMSAAAVLLVLIAAVTMLTNPMEKKETELQTELQLESIPVGEQSTLNSMIYDTVTLHIPLCDGWTLSEEFPSEKPQYRVGFMEESYAIFGENGECIGSVGYQSIGDGYADRVGTARLKAVYGAAVSSSVFYYDIEKDYDVQFKSNVFESAVTTVHIVGSLANAMGFEGDPQNHGILACSYDAGIYVAVHLDKEKVSREQCCEIAKQMKIERILHETVFELPEVNSSDLTMDFEILENYFYGTWQATEGQLTNALYAMSSLNVSYKDYGGFGPRMEIRGMYEDEENAYMVIYTGAGNAVMCQVRKDDTKTMIFYDDVYGIDPLTIEPSCVNLYSYVGSSDNGTFGLGEISPFGAQKLESLIGASPYSLDYSVTIDGVVYEGGTTPGDATLEHIYLLSEPTEDSFEYIRQMKIAELGDNSPRYNIKMRAEKVDDEWKVVSAELLTAELDMPEILEIPDERDMDFSIYENYFYGLWQHSEYWLGETRIFTYQENSGSPYSAIIALSEDEEYAYMLLGDASGSMMAYCVPKGNTEYMIHYDWASSDGTTIQMEEAELYRRLDGEYSTEITSGPISIHGSQRLAQDIGVSLYDLGNEVTLENGMSYRAWNGYPMTTLEVITLLEEASDDSLHFVRQLISADEEYGERYNIYITALRENDDWVVTDAGLWNPTSYPFQLGSQADTMKNMSVGDSISTWTLTDFESESRMDDGTLHSLITNFDGRLHIDGALRRHSLMDEGYELVLSTNSKNNLPCLSISEAGYKQRVITLNFSEEQLKQIPELDYGEEVRCSFIINSYRHVFAYSMVMDSANVQEVVFVGEVTESGLSQYESLISPLLSAQILKEDFSEEDPLVLDGYDWYFILRGLDISAFVPSEDDEAASPYYSQDLVEGLLSEYFLIDWEKSHEEMLNYDQNSRKYWMPEGLGGLVPSYKITNVMEDPETVTMTVELYNELGENYNRSELTIRYTADAWYYESNVVRDLAHTEAEE